EDEIDRLADTLNARPSGLQAAFGVMQRFTADAAHELRTPLTALRGGIEIALRAERSPDEYRRVLTSSIEEVDQLIRLAEDLLLLSRSTVGLTAMRQPVDVEPLCLEALELGVRLAKGKGVTVSMGATAPAVVRGDAGALRRALLTLAANPVNYTPAARGGRGGPRAGRRGPRGRGRPRGGPAASSSPSFGSTRDEAATRAAAGSVWPSPARLSWRTAVCWRSTAARAAAAASRSACPPRRLASQSPMQP